MRELEKICKKIKPIKPREHRIRNFFKKHKEKAPYLLMGAGISLLLASGGGFWLHKNSEAKDSAQKSSIAFAQLQQAIYDESRKMHAEAILKPAEEPVLTESEAKKLAKRIGFPSSRINTDFLYAVNEIGHGLTERLYKDYGITHFARYASYVYKKDYDGRRTLAMEPWLKIIAANRWTGKQTKPILLLAHPRHDWNGAFDDAYWSTLNQIVEHYAIFVIESNNEKEFYKRVRFVAKKHGPINNMILGGHGSPTELRLGNGFAEKRSIDISDSKEIRRLRGCFSPHPTIILESCSTGGTKKGLAAVISRELRGTVFAPSMPGFITDINIDWSGKISAKYGACDEAPGEISLCSKDESEDVTRIFEKGKLVSF